MLLTVTRSTSAAPSSRLTANDCARAGCVPAPMTRPQGRDDAARAFPAEHRHRRGAAPHGVDLLVTGHTGIADTTASACQIAEPRTARAVRPSSTGPAGTRLDSRIGQTGGSGRTG